MGGGFFDNMWDPYSGAFAYPRTQPRARYNYRPGGSVYEQRPVYEQRRPVYEQRPVYEHPYEQRRREQVENHFPGKVKVEEPVAERKTVRTIPVTDGNVAVEAKSQPEVLRREKVEVARPVVRFESEDAAARKIQGVYRGYSVRRTEPLKHLRVIMKVREEFQEIRRKLEGREQRAKLCSDPQERLRWTEGIMALLLRLDQLQGVHPEVRLVRKAAAKELLVFQEKLDSMSEEGAEEEGGNGFVAEETSEVCDAAEQGVDGDVSIPAAEEAVEEMEVEENKSSVEDVDVEEAPEIEAESAIAAAGHQEAMEQVSAPVEGSDGPVHDSDCSKSAEISTSEQRVADDNGGDQGGSPPESTIGESMVKDAEQDCSELGFTQVAAEVPMDIEKESPAVALARDIDDANVEAADFPHVVPPMDVESDREETSGVDDPAGVAPPTDFDGEPMVKEDSMENREESHDVERSAETFRVTDGAERPEVDTLGVIGDDPLTYTRGVEERATDAGDGWMIPACPTSLQPQYSAKGLQVGQPQISSDAGETNSLSDRALLEQLLEENRKLKDVVGKVLHWGKQQNDIIHSLASRIEHLEEHQPQPNTIQGEKVNGRKRICNDGGLVGDRERSLRSKGRRKERQGSRPQLGYLDSEWLSGESDEYF
ncbi:hypothetical protein M758_4G071100 [Ceratodon purpureus]|nr:hypothetical protein M758_4G071100 [Ceratodon purpureus]